MSSYLLIRSIHIACAVLTFLGFVLRGYWMLIDARALQHKLTRTLPHVVDTLLLGSAITLVLMSRQYPFVVGWVTLKIGLLLLYIVLGTFALKRGKTRQIRLLCLAAALVIITLIFWTALAKPVLPF